MRPRFLADADFNYKIVLGLRRREPAIHIQGAQEGGNLDMSDAGVLDVAALSGRTLISHDRKTMPAHLARFLQDRTSPGLIIVPQSLDIGAAIDDLILLWLATGAEEWRDKIGFLPL